MTKVEMEKKDYIINDYSEVLRISRSFNNFRNTANEKDSDLGKCGYLTFNIAVTGDSLFYIHEGKYKGYIFSYHLNSLGLFGAPEFYDFTCLKRMNENHIETLYMP